MIERLIGFIEINIERLLPSPATSTSSSSAGRSPHRGSRGRGARSILEGAVLVAHYLPLLPCEFVSRMQPRRTSGTCKTVQMIGVVRGEFNYIIGRWDQLSTAVAGTALAVEACVVFATEEHSLFYEERLVKSETTLLTPETFLVPISVVTM